MVTKKPQSILQSRSTGSYRVVGAGKRSALTGRYIVEQKVAADSTFKVNRNSEGGKIATKDSQ